EELSTAEERYPLPLGTVSRTLKMKAPKAQLLMGKGGLVFKGPVTRTPKLGRRELARRRIEAKVAKPITIVARTASVARPLKLESIAGSGFRVRPPNVPSVAPPPSPLRRKEMQDI